MSYAARPLRSTAPVTCSLEVAVVPVNTMKPVVARRIPAKAATVRPARTRRCDQTKVSKNRICLLDCHNAMGQHHHRPAAADGWVGPGVKRLTEPDAGPLARSSRSTIRFRPVLVCHARRTRSAWPGDVVGCRLYV